MTAPLYMVEGADWVEDGGTILKKKQYLRHVHKETSFNIASGFRVWADES